MCVMNLCANHRLCLMLSRAERLCPCSKAKNTHGQGKEFLEKDVQVIQDEEGDESSRGVQFDRMPGDGSQGGFEDAVERNMGSVNPHESRPI